MQYALSYSCLFVITREKKCLLRDRTGLRDSIVLPLESVEYPYFTKNTDFWHRWSIGEMELMRFAALRYEPSKIACFLRSQTPV